MVTRETLLRSEKIDQRTSKTVQLSKSIAQRIVDGQFPAGTLLASENELSSAYAMSRPQVRQALQRLAATGLIETKHGLGSYINPKERWNLFDSLLLNAFMQSNNLAAIADELIELRKMVELECSRLAATRITQTELSTLKQWLDQMDTTISNAEAISQADIFFHDTIIRASHNRFLQGIMSYLHDCLARARLLAMKTTTRDERLRIQRQHKAIYTALARHDAEAAQEAMQAHMTQHEKDMKNALLSLNL
jgi:GntR family transcriptional regulator, transcriptional repressor for pyruvate dehydrogenase complex